MRFCVALSFFIAMMLMLWTIVLGQENSKHIYMPFVANESRPRGAGACAQAGYWLGTVGREQAVSFTVEEQSPCQITDFAITHQVDCAGEPQVARTLISSPLAISETIHTNTEPRVEITGTFSLSSTISGTWNSFFDDAELGTCTGSGTWSANQTFPITSTRLFLIPRCDEDRNNCLDPAPMSQGYAIYTLGLGGEITFPVSLNGDITGSDYGFGLYLGSRVENTALSVDLIAAGETVVSTDFSIDSESPKLVTRTVTGVDPVTNLGDDLVLRIANKTGSGVVAVAPPPVAGSFITVPGENVVAISTPSPTATLMPSQTSTATASPSQAPTFTHTPTSTSTPTSTPTFSPTPTHTPTSTSSSTATHTSTSTPTDAPLKAKLYLRDQCSPEDNNACLSPNPEEDSITQNFNLVNTYPLTLTGDISGSVYEFSLMLGSLSSTTYQADILIGEEILASAEFVVDSPTFTRFTQTVSGIDPTTRAGDVMSLRVTKLPGTGALLIGPPPDQDSYIIIPGVVGTTETPTSTPPSEPTPTETPTLTPLPAQTPTPTRTPPLPDVPTPTATPAQNSDNIDFAGVTDQGRLVEMTILSDHSVWTRFYLEVAFDESCGSPPPVQTLNSNPATPPSLDGQQFELRLPQNVGGQNFENVYMGTFDAEFTQIDGTYDVWLVSPPIVCHKTGSWTMNRTSRGR